MGKEENLFADFGNRHREVYLRMREEKEGISLTICIGENGSVPKPAAQASDRECEDFKGLLLAMEKVKELVTDSLRACEK